MITDVNQAIFTPTEHLPLLEKSTLIELVKKLREQLNLAIGKAAYHKEEIEFYAELQGDSYYAFRYLLMGEKYWKDHLEPLVSPEVFQRLESQYKSKVDPMFVEHVKAYPNMDNTNVRSLKSIPRVDFDKIEYGDSLK